MPDSNSILDLGVIADPPDRVMSRLYALRPRPRAAKQAARHAASASTTQIPIPAELADMHALRDWLVNDNEAAEGLLALDMWLARFNTLDGGTDQPDVAELTVQVSTLLAPYLPPNKQGVWNALRRSLAQLLYKALVINALGESGAVIDIQASLVRLILDSGLVDLLVGKPTQILSSADIWSALRWRTVVLPDSVITLLLQLRSARGSILARSPGFADLYVTRDEWDHYEASTIASIENILAGEMKRHVHVLVNQAETATTTDTAKSSTQSQDVTTTDSTQLQQQSSADVSLAVHVDGGVDTTASYGPMSVTAHVGGSLDYSQKTADSKATALSHETVSRAVNSVTKETRVIRSMSTLSRATNKEIHEYNNRTGTQPTVGVYHWVDQLQNIELDKYPHRFLMEFELPEPGAWTRWLHANDASRGLINQPPAPFINDAKAPLQASDISAVSYQKFAARYSAVGISVPPAPVFVSATIKKDMPSNEYNVANPEWRNQPVMIFSDTTAAVPDGYIASGWTASVMAWSWGDGANFMEIAVGSGASVAVSTTPGGSLAQTVNGLVGPTAGAGITVGSVPVAVMTLSMWGFTVNVTVQCNPLPEAITAWQNSTYDQITAAYQTQLQNYNNERAGMDVHVSNFVDALSPEQNAKTIKQEIKRQVIEMLTGVRFDGRNAITWDPDPSNAVAPATDLALAQRIAAEIQFLEQAFEWETMSYFCYPYLWADSSRWSDLARIVGDDQNYADFVRAGSARVILAARPAFEDQVNLYTSLGILWGGGPAPGPGDPDYLSIASEIKAQQQRPLDVRVIDAWQERLPTTLVWLQNPDPLPSNPNPTIIPRPRIISVVPDGAVAGATVAIQGACFGATQDASTVTFNGAAALITSWQRSSLVVSVPAGATSGPVLVTVNGIASNPATFSIV